MGGIPRTLFRSKCSYGKIQSSKKCEISSNFAAYIHQENPYWRVGKSGTYIIQV